MEENSTPSDVATPNSGEWYKEIVSPGLTRRLLEICRDEDLGPDQIDPTAALMVDDSERSEAWVVSRSGGVVCGLNAIGDVLDVLAPTTLFRELAQDGEKMEAGKRLGALLGPRREILAAERTLLNLLGRLSGVATETARYVAAVGDSLAQVVDTRKTTPGLRQLEKYAVRCGGGHSHRMGLYDAVLIKDNHIAGMTPKQAAEKVARVAGDARERYEGLAFVEVEVDTLEQLEAMLELDSGVVDIVLLDNMSVEQLSQAVEMRNAKNRLPLLEASGGIELSTMGDVARTGVDRIAVGAITHHAVWVDIGLDMSLDAAPTA
ncbi:MAG: carboxylating nicotinate-nucleotide diphosphorylase [Phycisphaerales bacterium JB064]